MDIDEFLAAQRESGRVDSEGVFTIALEKARQKLSQYQLEDPSFYILRVVQAAVQIGTSRIGLRRRKGKLALWFDSAEPLGDLQDFLGALRSPVEVPEGPLRSLAVGFNSALFSSPLQTSFVWWSQVGSGALVASGEELSATEAPPSAAWLSEYRNLYLFTVSKAPEGWFDAATRAEYDALVRACGYCPVPIQIDGRRLAARPQPPPRKEPWLADYSEPFHLVERFDLDTAGGVRVAAPSHFLRKRGATGWLRTTRSAQTFSVQPLESMASEARCRNAYALPLGLRGPDKIHLVCHGVKVDTVSLESNGAGATAVMCADHLSFDLSGLGVRRDDAFHELAKTATLTWQEMARSVGPDLGELTSVPTEKEQRQNSERHSESCTCSCMSLFLAVLGLVAIPDLGAGIIPFVLGASTIGGAAVPFMMKKGPDLHGGLRAAVAQRLEQLLESWTSD